MTDSPFSVSSDSRWFDYNCSPKWGMAPYLANPEAHLYESESITNNLIGFILALASGAFIGSSFIIKKLGLQRAGASGPRAGKYFLILIFWEKRFTQSRCIIYVFLIYEWLTFFFCTIWTSRQVCLNRHSSKGSKLFSKVNDFNKHRSIWSLISV